MSGSLPEEQKKAKLRLLGNKIFEIIRSTSLNDGDLYRQADALRNATDRTEDMDSAMVCEIVEIMQGMLDPASVMPKEKATGQPADVNIDETLRLIDTQSEVQDEGTIKQLARHLGENGAVAELRQCLSHPALAQWGDTLRSGFVVASLKRAHGVDARELLDILHGIMNDKVLSKVCLNAVTYYRERDHIRIDLKDKPFVDALIGKTKGKSQEMFRSFCALGYMRTGTREAIQEAITIASHICHDWYFDITLVAIYGELTSLRPSSFRPLTSEEVDFAFTLLDGLAAEEGRSLADRVKHQRRILAERLLFETHDAYGRLDEKDIVHTIDQIINGGREFTWVVIMREHLREFYEDHLELQKQLEPLMRAMNSAYEIVLARQPKKYIMPLDNLPESERSLFLGGYNEKIGRLIEKELRTMEPGSRLLIPAGIFGHAISVELRKTTDSSFTCVLYNTGDGLDLHEREGGDSAPREKYYPLVWTDISPAALTYEFFQKMFSIEDNSLDTMENFVELMCLQLGEDDKVAAQSMRAYHSQGLGSCSYKSLSVFLHTAMEEIRPGLYDQYKRETTSRLLQRFDKAFPEVHAKKAGSSNDLSEELQDVPLNRGQLLSLYNRAEKTLKRRNTRDVTFHQFSHALSGALPMDEALALLSSTVDMKDDVIVDRFLKHVWANGTVSQLRTCFAHPNFAQCGDVLHRQFVMALLTRGGDIDAKELLDTMSRMRNKEVLHDLCHDLLINYKEYDPVRLEMDDMLIVYELVGNTEGECRDAVLALSALWSARMGTEATIRQAFALVAQVQESWYRAKALISICQESEPLILLHVLGLLGHCEVEAGDMARRYIINSLAKSSNIPQAIDVLRGIQTPKVLARALTLLTKSIMAAGSEQQLKHVQCLLEVADSQPEHTRRYLEAVLQPIARESNKLALKLLKHVMEEHREFAEEIISRAEDSGSDTSASEDGSSDEEQSSESVSFSSSSSSSSASSSSSSSSSSCSDSE